MDIMTFRVLVDRIIHNHPKDLQDRIKSKINSTLKILNKEYISEESVAIIAMIQELEYNREIKDEQ